MPNDAKNIQATLREVVGETGKAASDTPAVSETKESSTAGSTTETKSGEPVREYVSGIDVSDIPEQDRPRIKELLSKKAKLLEDGYNPKFQRVAHLAKTEEDIKALGLTPEEIQKTLSEYVSSKKAKPAESDKAKSLRTLDRLIDNAADAEQREALKQMRTIVEEETGIKQIQEKLDRLEKFYQLSTSEIANKRQLQLESDIKQLEEQYGVDVVGKYKDEIIKHGMNSNNTVRRLLHAIAEPEEIEQAILSKQTSKPNNRISEEKLNAISSNGSGIAGSKENLDVKRLGFKELFRELAKK